MKNNNILKNIITSFIVQIAITVQGLIIPRIILVYFGSSINGLVSSLTQYLNLFAIVEGGVSGVILAALYKPLSNKDEEKTSRALVSSNTFLKKLGMYFALYCLALAIAYPFLIKNYSWIFTFTLAVVLSISMFLQYYFTLLPQLLLRADDKFYVVNLVQILFICGNVIATIVCVKIFPEIHFIKLIASLVFALQPVILNTYVKHHYYINWDAPADGKLLKDRWSGFGISLAYVVTTNVDVILLTAFANLKTVSIYTIYSQILVAIRGLVNSISNGFQAQIGQLIAKNDQHNLDIQFGKFEFSTNYISGVLFSSCTELIVPFVLLYTSGVTDANYNQPIFAILINLCVLLQCIREPYIQFTYCAGHFKQTAKYGYMETVINLVVSIILVIKYGLIGVMIGTIASTLFRYIATVIYLHNTIYQRPYFAAIKQFLVEMVCVSLSYVFVTFLNLPFPDSIFAWVVRAVFIVIINIIICSGINLCFYRKRTIDFLSGIRNKIL